jgi:uncharacterized membrane protein YtjA (UPF0391 family)
MRRVKQVSRAFPGKVDPGFPSGNAPKQRVRVFSRFEEKRKNSKTTIFAGVWNIFAFCASFYRACRGAAGSGKLCKRGSAMLKWALIFFVISLIAGVFGFTGISAAAAGVARILFFIAVVIFLVFLVLALMAGSAVV